MKRLWMIVVILILVAGCAGGPSPIDGVRWKMSDDWIEKYGDSSESQIAFDLALLRQNVMEIIKAIKIHDEAIRGLMPDPNSTE